MNHFPSIVKGSNFEKIFELENDMIKTTENCHDPNQTQSIHDVTNQWSID